jgi:hypothetical protein
MLRIFSINSNPAQFERARNMCGKVPGVNQLPVPFRLPRL